MKKRWVVLAGDGEGARLVVYSSTCSVCGSREGDSFAGDWLCVCCNAWRIYNVIRLEEKKHQRRARAWQRSHIAG